MMRKGAAGSGVAMGFLRRTGVKPPAELDLVTPIYTPTPDDWAALPDAPAEATPPPVASGRSTPSGARHAGWRRAPTFRAESVTCRAEWR